MSLRSHRKKNEAGKYELVYILSSINQQIPMTEGKKMGKRYAELQRDCEVIGELHQRLVDSVNLAQALS